MDVDESYEHSYGGHPSVSVHLIFFMLISSSVLVCHAYRIFNHIEVVHIFCFPVAKKKNATMTGFVYTYVLDTCVNIFLGQISKGV